MLAALEHRFGDVSKAPAQIEWLTDNGSGYIAEKTRTFASDIGLKPLTPVCSPQSNAMAESCVKTMKRDYVAFMPKPDGRSQSGRCVRALQRKAPA
jgi:putative transposase